MGRLYYTLGEIESPSIGRYCSSRTHQEHILKHQEKIVAYLCSRKNVQKKKEVDHKRNKRGRELILKYPKNINVWKNITEKVKNNGKN